MRNEEESRELADGQIGHEKKVVQLTGAQPPAQGGYQQSKGKAVCPASSLVLSMTLENPGRREEPWQEWIRWEGAKTLHSKSKLRETRCTPRAGTL